MTILLALGTAFLIGLAQAGPNTSSPKANLPQPGGTQTARQAYEALQSWMVQWAGDAQLVSAYASLLKKETEGMGWSFQVYSPARQRLAVVLVSTEKIWVLRDQPVVYPQRALDLPLWSLDSDDVLEKWWPQYGAGLWASSKTQNLNMHLGTTQEGILVWEISLLNVEGDLLDYAILRADNGEMLTLEVPGGEE
ncbi:MAG: hypothetical protein JXA21_28610 [Anaerolineae bacterium]|nr:hypothetical protein [Anaerolineae bacterium]